MESVLNSARLEEGRIEFKPAICQIADLVEELSDAYAGINKDHHFHVNVERAPESVYADRTLLRQVISNLLSNAVKYSGPGTKVWVTADVNDAQETVITVRDEGVGIPREEQKKLFDRFFRATTSTGIAGTGIGLHLASHLAALHCGRIELVSDEGAGSAFSVYLPQLEPETADTSKSAAA